MIFTEEVEVTESELKIKVSCKIRKYARESKHIYDKSRIKNLIPEDLREVIRKTSEPKGIVSNLNRENHTNSGVWSFSIKPKKENLTSIKNSSTIKAKKESNTSNEKPKTTKTTRTRTRRPRSTKD